MAQFFIGISLGLVAAMALSTLVVVPDVYNKGTNAGAVYVASGQWKCELIQAKDKTTSWKCGEAVL